HVPSQRKSAGGVRACIALQIETGTERSSCGQAEAVSCNSKVAGVEFYADEVAAFEFRRQQCRAGAAKWVENDIAGLREGSNERLENAKGFLRRVQAVAGVLPVEHIWNALRRLRRISFCKQIRVFVVVAQKSLGRRILLGEGQMSGQPKAGLPPRCDELIGMMPSVEADTEGILSQHAKDFMECGFQPRPIGVVRN